jgi:hypothetical protein
MYVYRKSALSIFITVATTEKSAPEDYNTYLHSKQFRPASILNRVDAVYTAFVFIRYGIYTVAIQLVVLLIHNIYVCTTCIDL